MKTILFYATVILITASCSKNSKSSGGSIVDTIRCPVQGKVKRLFNYRVYVGVVISDYYTVKDSLAIDLDGDNQSDLIALLSPVIIEDPKYFFYSDSIQEVPKRILVEILKTNYGNRIRNVYENLSSDIPSVLSTYNGMSSTSHGFEIVHESGNRYGWRFVSEFSTGSSDSIYLIRTKKECRVEHSDSSITNVFSRRSVRMFNVNDTIQNDCNCDGVWEKLEAKIH